jgi:hypothetical protein
VAAAGEAADVTDVADQAGRTGRADAVQLLQGAAAGRDQIGQLVLRHLDLLVDLNEFGYQFRRQSPAGATDKVTGPDRGQQRAGPIGTQERLRPARQRLQQQLVNAVEQVGAGPAEFVSTVDEQPQRHRLVVDGVRWVTSRCTSMFLSLPALGPVR